MRHAEGASLANDATKFCAVREENFMILEFHIFFLKCGAVSFIFLITPARGGVRMYMRPHMPACVRATRVTDLDILPFV